MTTASAKGAQLVVEAQRGDARARDALVAECLPLLYNVVGRALSGDADVDDVVQETLLRAVRDLKDLRSPESFRPWLLSIAAHQIDGHLRRRRTAAERTAAVDAARALPDEVALENETVLRLELSDERRQVVEATRWLDPGFRAVLGLWWQEAAGLLSRQELAQAVDTSVAHAGVRVQRMREQMEQARGLVAALTAKPRCPDLAVLISGWDGERSPVWRKRIVRHTRQCPVCAAADARRIPLERLLPALAPLAVPSSLLAALHAKGLLAWTSAASAAAGSSAGAAAAGAHSAVRVGRAGAHVARHGLRGASPIRKVVRPATAHPAVTGAVGAALIVGTVIVTTTWPPPGSTQKPTPTAAPTASVHPASQTPDTSPSPSSIPAGTLPLGSWSLELVAEPDHYLAYSAGYADLAPVSAASSLTARREATFTVVHGLADTQCVSFIASDGLYLRHYELRLQLNAPDGTQLFREDATFCPHPGKAAGSVHLQSLNYPYLVIRLRDGEFHIDVSDGTTAFDQESTFIVHPPWA